jgi:hypothetical protein
MIARGFKSVLWVGAVGGAALGCYMVSLRVATERADLAKVDRQIVEAKRDIRSLKTELGTRGRLAQLEDWNANVLALSAPSSGQFVKDGYALARLQTRAPTIEERASEVRMASLDTAPAAPAASPDAAAKPESPPAVRKPARAAPAAPAPAIAPRIVQAVAAAPAQRTPLVRRASFTPTLPDAEPAAPVRPAAKPAKSTRTAELVRATLAAADKPVPAKKVPTAARPARLAAPAARDPRPAPRIAASTDKPQPGKAAKPARGAAKLAGADAALRPSGSGHRGGAQ